MFVRQSAALFLVPILCLAADAAEPTVIKLWPGKAPGESRDLGPEKLTVPKAGEGGVKRLTDVSEPTMTIYSPADGKNTGTAVIVAPGGGYSILAIEHEGTQVCEWLNSLGVTAVLLKYRVPKRPMQMPDNLAALQDAQRAITMVREKYSQSGKEPMKVGMLGFSAGGHLTACASLAEKRLYERLDPADDAFSFVPDFALCIYPAYLADSQGKLKPELTVRKGSPPMFFAHASDDPVSSENSIALYSALKKNNVPAELHLYASGGHGFGMNKIPHPAATWPDRASEWMKARGLLNSK